MTDSQDLIRLDILLYMIEDEDEACSVSGMARALQREKYTISRVLSGMEKEGLICRTENRHAKLTQKGKEFALEYHKKVSLSVNHLLYEGVDTANARHDALYWALYNSDQTMDVIAKAEARYQAKYELRNEKVFSGKVLCEHFPDGNYAFPFMIYRGREKNGNIISMANNGFEHPCILSIKNGTGNIELRAVKMNQRSQKTGTLMSGSVRSMKYHIDGYYTSARRAGDILQIPADALHFENIGDGIGQILHGTVALKMTCTAGLVHMPESTAIFTVLI